MFVWSKHRILIESVVLIFECNFKLKTVVFSLLGRLLKVFGFDVAFVCKVRQRVCVCVSASNNGIIDGVFSRKFQVSAKG